MTDTIKALKKAFDDLRFVERMCLVDPPHPAKELDVGYRIGLVRKDLEAALAAPQPEPLSMSMFANRADYEEALKAQPQPICPACHGPGLLYECVWCSAKNHPPEPQPFKQESWITAARLVVEATPEQLPMAIDAMRDLVEGAKP